MPNRPPVFRLHDPPPNTERDREYDKRRGTPSQRGYNERWARFSKQYRKLNPLCVNCLAHGVTRASAQVDHIVPLSKGGKKYDYENLQALCRTCHSQKTARERHER